jgi:hypothetical protein
MVFWASILAGGLFIWLAVRIGFFEMWTMLFNIVISVYVAIFLTPVIMNVAPAAGDTSYGHALTLAAVATGTFLLLFGISYVFLTGQFSVAFPKVFDILFAGILGFLAGSLVFSFAALIVTVTPLSQNRLMSKIGFNAQSQRANIAYISRCCDLIHLAVSSADSETTAEQTINALLSSVHSKTPNESNRKLDPYEPIDNKELNEHTKKSLESE